MKNFSVYSINNCGFCEAAKSLLKSHGLSFQEINISGDDQARIELVQRTGHRTMPQIFIDDEFIGGYQELKAYLTKDNQR